MYPLLALVVPKAMKSVLADCNCIVVVPACNKVSDGLLPPATGAASEMTNDPGVFVAVVKAPEYGACGLSVRFAGVTPVAVGVACEIVGPAMAFANCIVVTLSGTVPPVPPLPEIAATH
jgi:hypothetical protein